MRSFYDADLSGITASNIPFWFQHFYKPGKKISKYDDWEHKLDKIVERAPEWDIGFVVGVPAWVQILLIKIIARYKLKNIHEIWPNLAVFVHGGVAMEPYQNSFNTLLGKKIEFIETYLASEGFLAFQSRPGTNAMKLVINNGIFYEFIPFNDTNFDQDGNLKAEVETLLIDEIKDNQEYALLISTCAGAWRYLIGDVIMFTNKSLNELVITGRTKHFLSICGEHLSVDNMNKAISRLEKDCSIDVVEFTVTGLSVNSSFGHRWFLACDRDYDEGELKNVLDRHLRALNDDYNIERNHALKYMELIKVPTNYFYEWMKSIGKLGGQHKFPRVLKGENYINWENFLIQKGLLRPAMLAQKQIENTR
ncbi:MAG: GH3 auxin-responsive promoter family protein [Cyclobacteriaceae bacterium]|nr:GH3 auxin-responsive promoter family protein [Cyclobacteriaceae bacterium]